MARTTSESIPKHARRFDFHPTDGSRNLSFLERLVLLCKKCLTDLRGGAYVYRHQTGSGKVTAQALRYHLLSRPRSVLPSHLGLKFGQPQRPWAAAAEGQVPAPRSRQRGDAFREGDAQIWDLGNSGRASRGDWITGYSVEHATRDSGRIRAVGSASRERHAAACRRARFPANAISSQGASEAALPAHLRHGPPERKNALR